ncbi:hypothetical protein T492DRAFT_906245, partial [Pavlovales sp. CCMP2436]
AHRLRAQRHNTAGELVRGRLWQAVLSRTLPPYPLLLLLWLRQAGRVVGPNPVFNPTQYLSNPILTAAVAIVCSSPAYLTSFKYYAHV